MKAAIRTGWSGTTFSFSETQPLPSWDPEGPNANDIYLQVQAAGLNPVDYKLPKLVAGPVYGLDCCGVVEKVGQQVKNVQVGDLVVGPAKTGSLTEFTTAEASKVAKVRTGWSPVDAAVLPVAYDTVMTALDDAGILAVYQNAPDQAPIESLLVIGASGGCGLAATQIAKGLGISRIVGICSSKNNDFCQSNGATEVVPYDDPTALDTFYQTNQGKFDLIYDAASFSGGGEAYSTDPQVLALLKAKPGDAVEKPTYLALNGTTLHWVRRICWGSPSSDQRLGLVMAQHSTKYLTLVMELMDKAKAKPVIDSTLEFTRDGLQEGFKKLKSRRVKGKLVVQIA